MGKAGRFACIFVPMALTIASLITLLVIFLGGLNKNDANLRSLYYFKADTSQFKANGTSSIAQTINKIPGVNTELTNSLIQSVTSNELADVYYIYMWNYCSGSKTNSTGNVNITFCSPRQAQFYFNPVTVWGLNNTLAQEAIPKELNAAISAYQKASKWMFIAYVVAFCTTAASVIIGLFGICSRIGSCLTTFVSSAATLFTIISALTSTILFSIVVGGLNTALKPYEVHSALGTHMIAIDWLAAAFSAGATLFWLFSSCCCSGKSDRRRNRGYNEGAYKTGYSGFGSRGYQPLDEQGQQQQYGPQQYGQQQYGPPPARGMEMQDYGHTGAGPYKGRDTAYEPLRHDRV